MPLDGFWQMQCEALQNEAIQSDFASFLMQAFYTLHHGQDFASNWHIDLLCDYLEALESGQIHRLIINMPPRYLKSLCVSVAWPAWLLAQKPQTQIIVASYALSLSQKHSQDSRHLMQAEWYRKIFPNSQLMRGQNEKHLFYTEAHGFRMAASVGGAVTGYGGDYLIVDDPINPMQAESLVLRGMTNRWFEHTFSSRLNSKQQGRLLVMMQRVHDEDLSGYLLRKGGWDQVSLSALAERTQHYIPLEAHYRHREGEPLHARREGTELLERIKREMGSLAFAAQYQQEPVRREGEIIKREWLHRYKDAPEEGLRVHSWDTAIKSGQQHDYSACATALLHDGALYLTEMLHTRLDYPALRQSVIRKAESEKPDAILIEDKASGQSLIQELRQELRLPVIACQPKLDKVTRLAAVSPYFESGKIRLPQASSWLAEFEQELLGFPNYRHDDMVDAVSQLLHWFRGQARVGDFSIRRL